MKIVPVNTLAGFLLKLMALNFNTRAKLKKYMKDEDGWINFSVGIETRTGTVSRAIIFHDGKVTVTREIPKNVDVTLRFSGDDALLEMLGITPNEMLTM
ncbi:MAG: hypothetical protein ACOCWZ_09460, partial [Spirochaetota bacterium]